MGSGFNKPKPPTGKPGPVRKEEPQDVGKDDRRRDQAQRKPTVQGINYYKY